MTEGTFLNAVALALGASGRDKRSLPSALDPCATFNASSNEVFEA